MTAFTIETESYIEHEVQLRLHEKKFESLASSIHRLEEKLDSSIYKLEEKLDSSIHKLEEKLDSSIKHLDNKFMLMFSILLGSIWLPAILHYLHVA